MKMPKMIMYVNTQAPQIVLLVVVSCLFGQLCAKVQIFFRNRNIYRNFRERLLIFENNLLPKINVFKLSSFENINKKTTG